MRTALVSSVLIALCTAAPCATAQLYKWVDESGVVNYGDLPPDGVKVQPVTHGTVSSVSGAPRQRADATRPRDSSRRSQGAPPQIQETVNVSVDSASGSSDDPDYVAGYAPYYGYPVRRAAAAEAIDRPRIEQPIAKPILPINPAIPDMPARARR